MSSTKLSAIDVLYNAVVSNAKSDDVMKQAFIAAGGDQDEPKRVFMSACIAFSLKINREAALVILGKKGRGKNPDDAKLDDNVRTVAEEKAYGAARVKLSGRLKAWGIKTSEARGGDRTSDNVSTMDTDNLVMAPKPKVASSLDLATYCAAFAKQGYDFFLLNKAHKAVTSDHGSELMGAFADFLASVEDINSKHKA